MPGIVEPPEVPGIPVSVGASVPARRGLRWAPAPRTRRDELAVRAACQPARTESTPGESGGQGCSCCHDNPGGQGPRASGLLSGGRRRGGRGRPLSVASARPRVPCSVPGGGGGRSPLSSRRPKPAPRRSAGWRGPSWRESPAGPQGGQPQSEGSGLRLLRVSVWNFLSPWGPDARLGGCFLTLPIHVCDLIKHFLLSLKQELFMTSPFCQRHLPSLGYKLLMPDLCRTRPTES
nr:collagen alpha-2(I) chain-like [Meriones unguiculatus]